MSIADLLSRATPEARYYDYDRKIMEDYDNRINIYNDALNQYKSDYDVYKGKIDAHNELANAYNTRLQDYTKQAEDYNAAVQQYLRMYQGGQGGPSFEDSPFYVEKPGEFNESAPIFKGGDEPTAPADPGFKKQDVDAFIDEATGRATRRGQTAATAFNVLSQGGNFSTAPQVQGGAGVGTTPEFSFSATGFENGGGVGEFFKRFNPLTGSYRKEQPLSVKVVERAQDFTPIGTAETVREIYKESQEEDPNKAKIGIMALAELAGYAPAVGPGAKRAVRMMMGENEKPTQQLIEELYESGFNANYNFKKQELEELTDFSPEKIDRIATRYANELDPRNKDKGMAEGGVVENVGSIRALGNLEYEADMRPFLQDSLSQLGFNPDKASYNSQGLNRGDTYTFFTDKINIDPRRGGASQEIQAHEYRHRGLQRLLDDYFMKDPGRFKEKYGNDAYGLMLEVYDESRRRSKNLTDTSQKDSVHEKIAEYFQRPQKFNAGVLYYTSDGGVFQTEEQVKNYVKQNPGVEFMRKEIEGDTEFTLETPRVKEFRDYMINKNRGETMQQGTDSEFEAVQSIQKAAADVLSGKYGKGGVVSFAPYLR